MAALPAVDALDDDWARLAAGSVPAIELTANLAAHDEIAGQAIQLGAAGKFAAAIRTLALAGAQLTAARTVRDALASRIDTAAFISTPSLIRWNRARGSPRSRAMTIPSVSI